MRKLGKITIKKEVVDLDAEFGDLDGRKVSEGMVTTAPLMGRIAALWGEAEGERVEVDAAYRHWRAQYARDILDKDEKLAEHKVKAAIESSKEFLTCKDAIGRTVKNCTLLKGLFMSFAEKGSQLQSRGAMMRAELEKTDISTKIELPDGADEDIDAKDEEEVDEPLPPPKPVASHGPRPDIRGKIGKPKPKKP